MARYGHYTETPINAFATSANIDYQLTQMPLADKQIYLKQNAANQFRDAQLAASNSSSPSPAYQQHHSRQTRQLPSAPQQVPSSGSYKASLHSQNHKHQLPRRNTNKPSALRLANLALLLLAAILISTAFFSSNWLEAERRYYGSKFRRLGLWRFCFNSFSAKDDVVFKKFYVGCRWIFADDYKPIRNFLLPTFFIATQLFYTAGFLLLVLICAGIIAVQQCFIIEREDHALRLLSVASLVSSASCSLAVLIFALNANGEDWMPDPQHNYFSWSFAAALIGSLFLWIVALLFFIEMKLVIKNNLRSSRT